MPGSHPDHVNPYESGLLQPLQLVQQARGFINVLRVKVPVAIPSLTLKKSESLQSAIQFQSALAHGFIPDPGCQLPTQSTGRFHQIGDDEDTSGYKQRTHFVEQRLLLRSIQVVQRQRAHQRLDGKIGFRPGSGEESKPIASKRAPKGLSRS
jgi:hypothetical protein